VVRFSAVKEFDDGGTVQIDIHRRPAETISLKLFPPGPSIASGSLKA
jgi:hypothetical protein